MKNWNWPLIVILAINMGVWVFVAMSVAAALEAISG